MLFQKNLLKILLERLVFYKLLVNFFPQAIWAKSQNKVSGTILSPVLLKGHMGQFAFHVFLCAIFSNPSHGLSGPFGFFAHPQWAPKKMPKKKLAQHGFYRLLFTGPSKANLGLYGFLSIWKRPQKKCKKKKLAQHGFYKLLITDPSKGNLGLCGFLSMWINPLQKNAKKKIGPR